VEGVIRQLYSEQAALDWRQSYRDLSYSIEQLPDEIEQKLLQLVRGFNLQYSSADFILTPSGEYYFVELNPNGQFYWTQPPTGLAMAEAMVDLLCFPEEYRLCPEVS
jgi:D-alanine-D-alanine ligase-like ATP-grasp enzyme